MALIACGLNSTVTATLAGQIVMEGFVELRMKPALRRLVTRLIAIVPAVAVTLISGEAATGRLLVLSQVVLSLTLPFAVVPLVWFTASRRLMGELDGAARDHGRRRRHRRGHHRAERQAAPRRARRLIFTFP